MVEINIPPVCHVVVTGGCGYLGSVLIPMLLDRNLQVTVYDNCTRGTSGLRSVLADPRLNIICGDIRDKLRLASIVSDADVVIHLAAIVGYPACDADPSAAVQVNEVGTANLVASMKSHQRLIYASTGSCYGAVHGIATEETPETPLTLYGRTKANAEQIVRKFGGVALRFATLFGMSPSMRFDLLLNDFTRRALNTKRIDLYEGHFKRTFLHVSDAARAIIFAMDNFSSDRGEAFNVGDENMNLTKAEVCRVLQELIRGMDIQEIPGHDMDQRNYEVSYKKIKEKGFKVQVSLRDGLLDLTERIPLTSEF